MLREVAERPLSRRRPSAISDAKRKKMAQLRAEKSGKAVEARNENLFGVTLTSDQASCGDERCAH